MNIKKCAMNSRSTDNKPSKQNWVHNKEIDLGLDNNIRVKSTFKPLSTNPTKWSNTLKQFVGNLRRTV